MSNKPNPIWITPDYISEIVREQIKNDIEWDWRLSLSMHDYQGNPIKEIVGWTASEHGIDATGIEANYLHYANKRYDYPALLTIEPLGDTHPAICPPARYWCSADHEGPREECEERRKVLWTPGHPLPHRFMVRGVIEAAKLTQTEAAELIQSSARSITRNCTGVLQMHWRDYHYLRIMSGMDPEWKRASEAP